MIIYFSKKDIFVEVHDESYLLYKMKKWGYVPYTRKYVQGFQICT